MTSYDHLIRLLVLIGLVLTGLLITAFLSMTFLLASGYSVAEMMDINQSGLEFSPGLTRLLVATQHVFTFILPGVVYGLVYHRPRVMDGLGLSRNPGWILSIMGIFFLLAAYPLVNLSFLVNETMPLPSWAAELENQAAKTIESIMDMKTPAIFIINILLIAVLPGIGEELIFRGIIQKQMGFILKNSVLAIWVSAFIFSAFHLQFEGFLPRMVLGVILGYLYYWTNNLWVPIIVHAFNNGIMVVLIYTTGMDLTSFDEQSSEQLSWWMVLFSVIVMYIIYNSIIKHRTRIEQA